MRPVAFKAEEIFLPRVLIDTAQDEALRIILRERRLDQLDAYLDEHGLRNCWYLVRYQGMDSEGGSWKGTTANFECKRYHVHSTMFGLLENKLANQEVFIRVMARAIGQQPDTIIMADKLDESIIFITHFAEARIVPIPNDVTEREPISKSQIDAWRKLAGIENP